MPSRTQSSAGKPPALRRELGSLHTYATLIGILVGAGIFKVTSDASAATGASVILAHLVLAPVVLASAVAYVVFLSSPLGETPGGEVLHIARTFQTPWLTFLCGWLKLVSYLGAGAYLADALAVNLLELWPAGHVESLLARRSVGLAALAFFFLIHAAGVRWFGRLQVGMCVILAGSLVVLIVPGLFAIKRSNYSPFFAGGAAGFAQSLAPLFFAYAGFESIAHAAGEVADSRERLPRVFVRGVLLTTLIFVAMSLVAFGVLPANELSASAVPMTAAAAAYLPFGATAVVTVGAVAAIATSLNATMLVPARLAWSMAHEQSLPAVFGSLHPTTGAPLFGLVLSFGLVAMLLLTGQMALALGIAVLALMLLYALHSVALLALPKRAPELYAEVTSSLPRRAQVLAASFSVLALGSIIALEFWRGMQRLWSQGLKERWLRVDLTSLELLILWVLLGAVVYAASVRRHAS